jgi:hypothetical protein
VSTDTGTKPPRFSTKDGELTCDGLQVLDHMFACFSDVTSLLSAEVTLFIDIFEQQLNEDSYGNMDKEVRVSTLFSTILLYQSVPYYCALC